MDGQHRAGEGDARADGPPVNQFEFSDRAAHQKLGEMTGHRWSTDPIGLTWTLARYKFVARMFMGYGSVVEFGCGDGWPGRIVAQHVDRLTLTDCRGGVVPDYPAEFFVHDLIAEPTPFQFEAGYALDVLEHIDPEDEDRFLAHMAQSVKSSAIIGMPSLESQPYASALSKAGHVNCKSKDALTKTLRKHFAHVFVFGMNDETLHTGFGPMCNYLMALCVK